MRLIAVGLGSLALGACSSAGAADKEQGVQEQAAAIASRSAIFVHCVGHMSRPVPSGTATSSLTSDYAIDEPNKRLLVYSVERQAMEPVGTDDDCQTNISDKLAEVRCAASQTIPDEGIETLTAHTRLDRVLGKLSINVTLRKDHEEGWRNSSKTVSGRADCTPGKDPTTIRAF